MPGVLKLCLLDLFIKKLYNIIKTIYSARHKMSKSKKKKHSHAPQSTRLARSAPPLTLREKKKQLIRERIHSDTACARGMRAAGRTVAAIMIMRVALLIYEIAYYSAIGEKINIISCILLLPLIVLLLMAHDGNKPLIGIPAVSAVARLIYLFASVYPSIGEIRGAIVFVTVCAAVMAAQFILSVVMLYMPSVDIYCKEMQKINLELRSHIITKR